MRWAQAGDLPDDGMKINTGSLKPLSKPTEAEEALAAPTVTRKTRTTLQAAIDAGIVIDACRQTSIENAEGLAALNMAPVGCVLLIDQTGPIRTPGSWCVAVFPAAVRNDITCASRGICAVPGHKSIIGFPAHGVDNTWSTESVFCQATMSNYYVRKL